MDEELANQLFFYLILVGIASTFVYFVVSTFEGILIKRLTPSLSYIPRVKFQTRLGHLAMLGSIGYMVAGLFAYRQHTPGSFVVFSFAIVLSALGILRFKQASRTRQEQKEKGARQNSKPQ